MDVLDVTEDAKVAGAGARLLAAIGGIALFVGATVISVGFVLLAPLGIWLANLVMKSRGRRLNIWSAWFAGSGTIGVVLLLLIGAALYTTGTNPIANIQRTMDSTSAEQRAKNRPAWLDRMSPPGTRERSDAMEKRLAKSPAAFTGMMVFGGIVGVEFLAVFVGTLGWAAMLLLYFASRGRWLR